MPQAEFPQYWRGDVNESIRVALSCRDSDHMGRVPNAGQIETLPDGREVQVMHNGIRVIKDGYRGPMITEIMRYLRGVHEPQEEKVFAEVLPYMPAGATMMEIGSYWAYYSLWFNKTVPDARNYCVEPDLKSLNLGIENFRLNNGQATFLNAGVKADASIDFNSISLGENHMLMPHHGSFIGDPLPPGPRRAIPKVTVDSLMEQFELQFIDLLHMDIQLAEVNLLKNSPRAFLDKKIGYVFISTHNVPNWQFGQDLDQYHNECLEIVRGYGYHIVAEHNMTDAYSHDGLIVAKLPGYAGPDHVHVSKLSQSDFALVGYEPK